MSRQTRPLRDSQRPLYDSQRPFTEALAVNSQIKLKHHYHVYFVRVVILMTCVINMLNKNSLAVKKYEANQKPQWL